MHRFRIHLWGPDAAVEQAISALKESGGLPIGPREPCCWVWAASGGWEAVERLSREHPAITLGVEGFEDFRDEIVSATVAGGERSLQTSRGLLPDGWGSFHDEDGRPLDAGLLAWAGSVIADRPAHPETSSLFCGLETALVVAQELGRFATDCRDFLASDSPDARTIEAIARLAQVALPVSAAARSRTNGELAYLLPLRLTQAVVHAAKSEFCDTPGNADWQEWLGLLLGSAGELVDEAHMCEVVPPGPDPALSPNCFHRDQGEAMESAARALVTSCVQTIALFGSKRAPGYVP